MRSVLCLSVALALAVPALASAGQPATPHRLPPPAMQRAVGYRVAAADPAQLCETAATTAEYTGRLPARLLGAISLTETGRVDPATGRIRPWPWTINAEGTGQFFNTREQAVAAVKALQERGVQSIDVGCMQVNLMYHPRAFASLDDAFDPETNATYAARFLNALYTSSKDWSAAIAAYHSETPDLGDAYRVLVMARWHNGDPHPPVVPQSPYGDFAQADKAYGAFAPRSAVYGAFAPH
ncbi:MAG TPA: transglycosylase SLT domain-containing protein [Rhodopila sp.]|jgi:soluble lytic murein transglycosylase-like protein